MNLVVVTSRPLVQLQLSEVRKTECNEMVINLKDDSLVTYRPERNVVRDIVDDLLQNTRILFTLLESSITSKKENWRTEEVYRL